jgi:hypothetical protein
MFVMCRKIVWIDEDAVKVNSDGDVEEILENIIHEVLEGCRGIGESKRHDEPFKQAIASPKHGLPFITVSNPNEMIGVV